MKKINLFFLGLFAAVGMEAQELTQPVLDSIHVYEQAEEADWTLTEKIYNQYGANGLYSGNLIVKIGEEGFANSSATEMLANDKTEKIRLQKKWDADSQKWVADKKFVSKYDEKGRQIEILNQFFEDGQWHDHYMKKTVYNAQGLVKEEINKYYDKVKKETTVHERTVYAYLKGKMVEKSQQMWDLSTQNWRNIKQTVFQYNDKGLLKSSDTQNWNANSNKWNQGSTDVYQYSKKGELEFIETDFEANKEQTSLKKGKRSNYVYNRKGELVEKNMFLWDNPSQDWKPISEKWFEYNSDQKLTEEGFKRYDLGTAEVNSGYRSQYEFDDHKKLLYRSQNWDADKAGWEDVVLQTFEYDGNIQTDAYFSQWDAETDELMYKKHFERFWSSAKKEKPEEASERIEVASSECAIPNPYTIGNSIYCSELEADEDYQLLVYDLNGKLLHRQTFRGGDPVSVNESLAGGMYIFKVQDPFKTRSTQKVVIGR